MSYRFVSACGVVGLCLAVGSVALLSAQATQGAKKPAAASKVGMVKPPSTDAEKIKSAMSAAPAAVAKDATIMDMPSMKVLRKGTNGWTCIPDGPSPGVDPMCLDANGMLWADAWMHHKDPPKDKLGFGYMLMGGSDASNTDPFATEPKPGARWVDTGPHVMVMNIGEKFAGYPTTSANPKVPYVMFPDTPYAHLMLPVK
ncbi:MAG TPA: hypothetical protein VEL79_12600 [Vicinamibacterales bacterium]|nr:hypothetical protein [Vicinamibacterales bacterium]